MDSTINLQRWQQAFEDHPISTTRAIEKQLRSSVANNRDRLRGLVGGNYRELLSTADRIVYLDAKTKAIEVRISEIGQKCGPPEQPPKKSSSAEGRSVAELWLLRACLNATSRAIAAEDILRASRMIVISRLLLKSLQTSDGRMASLSSLRDKVSLLRRRAIARVDAMLTNPRSKQRVLIHAASAYCLLTSASATEVFQYTLRLRLEKLRDVASTTISPNLTQEILQFILVTLQAVRRSFGRPLADGLSNLQRRPVVQDLELVNSEVIASEEIFMLISDDIRSFSPYFKREPVSASTTATSLEAWTRDASDVFTQVLRSRASETHDTMSVLALRRDCLSLLLPSYFESRAGSVLHDRVNKEVTARVADLGSLQMSRLTTIAQDLVGTNDVKAPNPTLWHSDLATMPLTNGSERFVTRVHKRYRGESTRLAALSKSLNAWILSLAEAINASQDIKKVRWQDMLEEPGDEQEDEAARVIELLSVKQPQELNAQIRESISSALEALTTAVMTAVDTTLATAEETERIVYLLRAIRLVLGPLSQAFPQERALGTLQTTVPKLQQMIATRIAVRVYESHKSKSPTEEEIVEDLPSPAAFNLLQELCDAMQSAGGSDIWSHAAVKQVKQALKHELFPGNEDGVAWNEFDSAFLSCALSEAHASPPSSAQAKSAASYWQRTRLLFGVLAD